MKTVWRDFWSRKKTNRFHTPTSVFRAAAARRKVIELTTIERRLDGRAPLLNVPSELSGAGRCLI
jgi:hypothetical protein